MEVNVKTVNKVIVVELTGELDGKTAPEVQEKVLPQIPGHVVLLVVMPKELDGTTLLGSCVEQLEDAVEGFEQGDIMPFATHIRSHSDAGGSAADDHDVGVTVTGERRSGGGRLRQRVEPEGEVFVAHGVQVPTYCGTACWPRRSAAGPRTP